MNDALREVEWSPDNVDLDLQVLASDRRERLKNLKYPFQQLADFSIKPPRRKWLIKGIIARGETSAWIAPPGGLKSALLAELAKSVANQEDWHGMKAKACYGVLYFALELADLVRRRLAAMHIRDGYTAENMSEVSIAVCDRMVDLTRPDAVNDIKRTVDQFRDEICLGGPALLIFDTFAKLIAAGGGDEQQAKDQGKVFANIQRIKEVCGNPHVAIVGHTGKDETRGARGSSAFLGDVDVMVQISGEDVKTATVIKANDLPEGPLFSFKGEVHQFGFDEDGDPITVNIISKDDVDIADAKPSKAHWSKGLRFVRTCIDEALIADGINHQIERGPMVRAVALSSARAIHQDRYVSNGDGNRAEAERKAWARNFKLARDNGLVGAENVAQGELIWII